MVGYWHKAVATAAVLDGEGWFDTGDLGQLLADGCLVLTGRAKDTIVLSSGENIEPGPLEEALAASPLVEQVMVVGQDRKQLGALLVAKPEALAAFAAGAGAAGDVALRPASPWWSHSPWKMGCSPRPSSSAAIGSLPAMAA
jgi:long-chain acyl-CoA synthetase